MVIHGDLKDSNIFMHYNVQQQPEVKLLDFGLARMRTKHADALGGTLKWLAPEVVTQGQQATRAAVDTYGFGLLIYFVTVAKHPHWEIDNKDFKALLKGGELPALLWPEVDNPLQPLAEECSGTLAADRPPMPGVRRLLHERCGWRCPESNQGCLHSALSAARAKLQAEPTTVVESSGGSAADDTRALEDACRKQFDQGAALLLMQPGIFELRPSNEGTDWLQPLPLDKAIDEAATVMGSSIVEPQPEASTNEDVCRV